MTVVTKPTGVPRRSDKALLTLNAKILEVLKRYVPDVDNQNINISFEVFGRGDKPNEPTLCVFLYDIQEDLELRQGQSRTYDFSTGTYNKRQANVRCCYLVTYWETASEKSVFAASANSQTMEVMNYVLNALLNIDLSDCLKDEGIPARIQVIAPSEHLSSLGNFWQSLGDKPRLCLNFTVTIPITLGLDTDTEEIPLITQTELKDDSWEGLDPALTFKRALVSLMREGLDPAQVGPVSAQLARLSVTSDYSLSESKEMVPQISVAGYLDEVTHERFLGLWPEALQCVNMKAGTLDNLRVAPISKAKS
ncbi:DUF4255 domain-containing protein [Burkholderia cenocepacia]|uniref:DUF4255 domain-containing protein n=1 Tax=Burkholderia cenocepacia TaxID=95486 RepID=UPI000F5A4ADE|nr:DUF4255 domain-containing protein [Burkholderia cenocepacia]RQU52936.1 DUF4255 domain-containing protein [Burkholderia cenocepacia]RQV35058.1 DUF4255 domain-containing protein [Burkholderia cenocepacia]